MHTDSDIEHNKPEFVLFHKIEQECVVIDVACPFDTRVQNKEKEKIEKYQDLKRELKWIWKLRKIIVVPVIIGASGTIPKGLAKWLEQINAADVNQSHYRELRVYWEQPEYFTKSQTPKVTGGDVMSGEDSTQIQKLCLTDYNKDDDDDNDARICRASRRAVTWLKRAFYLKTKTRITKINICLA